MKVEAEEEGQGSVLGPLRVELGLVLEAEKEEESEWKTERVKPEPPFPPKIFLVEIQCPIPQYFLPLVLPSRGFLFRANLSVPQSEIEQIFLWKKVLFFSSFDKPPY